MKGEVWHPPPPLEFICQYAHYNNPVHVHVYLCPTSTNYLNEDLIGIQIQNDILMLHVCPTVHTFIKNLEVKIRGSASQYLQLGHQLHVQDTWNEIHSIIRDLGDDFH